MNEKFVEKPKSIKLLCAIYDYRYFRAAVLWLMEAAPRKSSRKPRTASHSNNIESLCSVGNFGNLSKKIK